MKRSKITSVTVSHIWDDQSTTETTISKSPEGDDDPTVSLKQEEYFVYLRKESWPEIRDQIDAMFQEMEGENQ